MTFHFVLSCWIYCIVPQITKIIWDATEDFMMLWFIAIGLRVFKCVYIYGSLEIVKG